MTGMTCMIRIIINEMTWMVGMTGITRTTSMTRMNKADLIYCDNRGDRGDCDKREK